MSDFLDSLIDRSLSTGPAPSTTLRPMLPSRFEPPRATPLFGSPAWDSSPDVNHDNAADRTSSPFTSTNTDAAPRIVSVTSGDGDRADTRSLSPFPPLASEAPADDSARRLRPTVERPRAEDAFGFTPQMSRPFEPDGDSWLHRRMDEMAVQLQRLRGDMASTTPLRSAAMAPAPTSPDDVVSMSRPVLPRMEESAAVGLRPTPAFDDAARGEDDSRSVSTRATENRSDGHPTQSLPSSPDFGRLEQLLSLTDRIAMQPPPSILPEVSPSASRQAVPATHSDEHRSQQLSPVPDFGQLDQLLSLARRAAMQPPPRIQPEDLPSSRQPARVERTINVTIGRVEVKATREPAPVRRPAPSQANSSVMSLDDYLKQRAAGGL